MGDAMSHAIPPDTASSWTTAGTASGRRGRSGLIRRWWQSAGHRQERRERLAQEPVSGLQESRRGRFTQKFKSAVCNGCHGGTGGGGMGPPLTNQIWVYGSDDDTLFPADCAWHRSIAEAGWSRPVGFGSAVSTAVCAIRAIASGPQIFKR